MERIKSLEGKSVAIVGLGGSWQDYNLAKSHGAQFDEVWTINSVGSVIFHDRTFMMDPVSRFLDTDDAGGQTSGMVEVLLNDDKPIYTCELDDRCKNLIEYPINEILQEFNCCYLNNTVAYAIAFALWNKVSTLKLFGIDFSYKGNLHFAEAGRGCVEFWLSKAMHLGVQVEVAKSSGLLDTNVLAQEKLYGYHRLQDPLVIMSDGKGYMVSMKQSEAMELQEEVKEQEPILIDRNDSHLKPRDNEPKVW
jgi:hypothetical protein|tara:strand:+ start:1725 stop:2474 length:750 start_codon:yes stop_codon:yes gene_type:complete